MGLRTYQGAVALVTGGASGIGRGLAEALARRGAEVWLADVQDALAEEVARSVRERGGRAQAVRLDVTDAAELARVVDRVFREAGRLDYFFNNAGIGVLGATRFYELRDWDRVIDVNLRGVCYGVQAVYPRMIEQGFGHVVNTASVAGLIATPLLASYGATKHAVVGLSKALRVEGAAHGVRVTALCPGAIRTPLLQSGGVHGRSLHALDPTRLGQWWEKNWFPIDVEPFAEEALDRIAKNQAIVVVPRFARWMSRLLRAAVPLELWFAKLQLERTTKLFPELAKFSPVDGRAVLARLGLLRAAEAQANRGSSAAPN